MLALEIRDYWAAKYSSRLVSLYGNGNNSVDWCLYMVMSFRSCIMLWDVDDVFISHLDLHVLFCSDCLPDNIETFKCNLKNMFLFISHIIVSYKLVPKESINVHLYRALTSTPCKCHKLISLKHVNVCIYKVLNDSLTKYNCCPFP